MDKFKNTIFQIITDINKHVDNTTKICNGECFKDIEMVMKNYPELCYTIKIEENEDYHINTVFIRITNASFIANVYSWFQSLREIYDDTFNRYLPEGYLYDGDLSKNILRVFLIDILTKRGKYPNVVYETNQSSLKVASL